MAPTALNLLSKHDVVYDLPHVLPRDQIGKVVRIPINDLGLQTDTNDLLIRPASIKFDLEAAGESRGNINHLIKSDLGLGGDLNSTEKLPLEKSSFYHVISMPSAGDPSRTVCLGSDCRR